MTDTRRSIPVRWALAGGLAGVVLGTLGIASAQTDDSTTTTTPPASSSAAPAPADRPARPEETPLTGDDAEKAKAAALAAVPGATIDRVETDADGASYEVHLTKPDGTRATVKLDGNFNVTATEDDQGRDCGPGGRGPELTGDTADKVKAAALAAVPGGTVEHMTEGRDGGYVALVTKPDGTRTVVKLDDAFKVTSTEAARDHGGPGGRHHGGPPPPPPADSTTAPATNA